MSSSAETEVIGGLRSGPGGPGDGRAGRRRTLRVIAYVLIALALLLVVAGAAVFLVTQKLGDQVGRYPSVFAPLDQAARPPEGQGQTFLLVGTDSRSPDPTTGRDAAAPDFVFGAQRSDVIMLATLAKDGKSASVVSIPRDSWVNVPGHGMNKINAAYSFGGPTLAVNTIEQLTGVRIDHFAVIDFAGFAQMTDAVGGIDIDVGTSTNEFGVPLAAGPQHLNGAQALAYVRERHFLPAGDLDRVKRQQNALRALVRNTFSSGTLDSPTKAYGLVDTVTQHVGIDDSMSNTALAGLAFSLRDLREPDISFVTTPTRGTGMVGSQSVVFLDPAADKPLWSAINAQSVGQWVAANPAAKLPDTPH